MADVPEPSRPKVGDQEERACSTDEVVLSNPLERLAQRLVDGNRNCLSATRSDMVGQQISGCCARVIGLSDQDTVGDG